MKIQLLSDLHVEFHDYDYPGTDADVVVLAGDIHVGERGLLWAAERIRNRPVVYVLGNHEFYGKTWPDLIDKLKQMASGSNIHILEKDVVTVDGVNFLGCTLWTDYALYGDSRLSGQYCQMVMNDHRKIRRSPEYARMRAMDFAAIHRQSRQWLDEQLRLHSGQCNVVVTHHAPSIQSVPEHRAADEATAAYASDLEAFISEHQPSAWLHGHVHHNADYTIDNCRVLCNPKGYWGEENPGFEPELVFTPEQQSAASNVVAMGSGQYDDA